MTALLQETERLRKENEQWRELALRGSQPQPQYGYQQEPANHRAFSYPEPPQYPPATLLVENPQEYDRQMQAWVAYQSQQAVQLAANQILPQVAEAGRFMSQNDPEYRDVWSKYSAEIEQEMVKNNVPPHMRTKQAWDLVAGVVRGRHYRELADEIANQRLQSGGLGLEGGGSTANVQTPASDPLSEFWASDHDWVRRAKNAGMSLKDVRNHVQKIGISEKQWVDDMTKQRSFSAEAA